MSFPDINNIDDLISAINEYFTSPRRPPLKGEEANFVLLKLLSLVVQYTDDQITALKGGAPEAYDTLMEIAEKLADDDGEIADLLTLINSKADVSDLDAKVDKAEGYGLSKNDYSDVDKALVDTISSKQDALSFDEEPQSGSNNSVKSGGIWAFVNNKVDDIQDQIDSIKKEIENSPYPVFVVGDFNSVPNSYEYYKVSDNLKDAFVEVGRGSGTSFHDFKFPLRIDYIFTSESIQPVSYKVDRDVQISDHFPVIATFKLAD